MSYIKQVAIKGFQSHLSSTFQLAPGLTVITGPSDAGKTAVIRALRWVAFNEPQGESFLFTLRNEKTGEIEKQADVAEVEIQFDNGIVISKARRKGKTSYRHSAFTEPWEKAEVPQEIKEALGLYKQSYGDNFETCLNFAYQLEAPFIISETPSVGAKILGKIAGTEVVDKAIAAISKNTHKTREEIRQADKTINELNIELLDYMDVDDHKQQVEACEMLLESIETSATQSDLLTKHYGTYTTTQNTISALNKKLEALASIPNLINGITEVEAKFTRCNNLEDLGAKHFSLNNWLHELSTEVEKYKKIGDAAILLGIAEKNSNRLNNIKDLSSLYKKYSQIIITTSETLDKIKNIDQANTVLRTLETSIEKLENLKPLNSNYLNFNTLVENNITYLTKFLNLIVASDLLNITIKNTDRLDVLQQLNLQYSNLDNTIQTNIAHLTKFTNLLNTSVMLDKVIKDAERLAELQHLKTEYEKRNRTVDTAIDTLKSGSVFLLESTDELKQAWEAAGDICPLCERPVNKGAVT